MGEVITQGLVASGAGCEGVLRRAAEIPEVLALMKQPDLSDTILLAESATATAIVPLLSRVRGLVCTSGGITSHLAIVSREFGLPCVMAAPVEDAAALEGARVVVEADGTVRHA
jgi:phosphoenolpyruvate-protein kinase (PTS system EI component)